MLQCYECEPLKNSSWDSAELIHFLSMHYYDLEKLGLSKEPKYFHV